MHYDLLACSLQQDQASHTILSPKICSTGRVEMRKAPNPYYIVSIDSYILLSHEFQDIQFSKARTIFRYTDLAGEDKFHGGFIRAVCCFAERSCMIFHNLRDNDIL